MANRWNSKLPRNRIILLAGAAVLALLLFSFWPRATAVDLGEVARRDMVVTIDEEARTRVHEAYEVSTPVAGRLLRVEVEAGDHVKAGHSVVARMQAAPPPTLDIRTQEQAEAAIGAAEAAMDAARSDLAGALATLELARSEMTRSRTLRAEEAISEAAFEAAERQLRSAEATSQSARAAVSMREADLAAARAQLITFRDGIASGDVIPIHAPISGRILRVVQKSEATLPAGSPILEIGDTAGDLEVVAEMLSTDAVQITAGDRVLIDNWGGDQPLEGVVERVEPWGFTKYSALGVEEQRVNVITRFMDPEARPNSLGHGYRVEVNVVIWEGSDVLTAPSSALFRIDDGWAVFVARGGRARLTPVEVGRNNGISAEVLGGLEEGQSVILFPGPDLQNGTGIRRRAAG